MDEIEKIKKNIKSIEYAKKTNNLLGCIVLFVFIINILVSTWNDNILLSLKLGISTLVFNFLYNFINGLLKELYLEKNEKIKKLKYKGSAFYD